MKLIKLEDAQKILVDYCDELHSYDRVERWRRAEMWNKILWLKSIDPIAIIDEMMAEDYIPSWQPWNIKESILQELKSRLTNNN